MRRTCQRCTKARLSFSGGPHVPGNMADSIGGEKRQKWHFGKEFSCLEERTSAAPNRGLASLAGHTPL